MAEVGPHGVPRCLLIGRCIQVWAADGVDFPHHSAVRRFGTVRGAWLREQGFGDLEGQKLIPFGAPWDVDHLTYRGQAERAGRTIADIVASYLGRGGCTTRDIPALRAEADEMFATYSGRSI